MGFPGDWGLAPPGGFVDDGVGASAMTLGDLGFPVLTTASLYCEGRDFGAGWSGAESIVWRAPTERLVDKVVVEFLDSLDAALGSWEPPNTW